MSRNGTCNYKRANHDAIFTGSLLGGYLGADWFALARGNAIYNLIGGIKLLMTIILVLLAIYAYDKSSIGSGLTLLVGCIVVLWWLVDWIRAATNNGFPDGNGYSMGPFSDKCRSAVYYLSRY